jgi:hypothetical protein
MATEKEIIALLLDAMESLYIERVMLVMMLMTYQQHFPIGDWEHDLERLKLTPVQCLFNSRGPSREYRDLGGGLRSCVGNRDSYWPFLPPCRRTSR